MPPHRSRAAKPPQARRSAIGGLVVPGSVKRSESGLEVEFRVTDNQSELLVAYQGILPDLFAEGQGVVAVGELLSGERFRAQQVLAKHDENYMPPEVHDALKAGEAMDQATNRVGGSSAG